jgi:hypothetical protein
MNRARQRVYGRLILVCATAGANALSPFRLKCRYRRCRFSARMPGRVRRKAGLRTPLSMRSHE